MTWLTAHVIASRNGFGLDATLEVDKGDTCAVLGPNGAGKSTLIAALSGLLPLDEGHVIVGGETWERPRESVRLAPQNRSVGVMFQTGALFPKMSVIDNVAYGLRARRVRSSTARLRAGELLERFGAANLAARRPVDLSGGEAQKVALARALAVEPALLLLDEPLSSLDVGARAESRRSIKEALADFAGVALVVTHEPLEALALARRMIVLEAGRVVQDDTTARVTARPRSAYAAELAGVNLFEGTLVERAGHWQLDTGAGVLAVSAHPDVAGSTVLAVVHPRAVTVSTMPAAPTSARNVLEGRVHAVEAGTGETVRVTVAGRPRLVAEITVEAASELRLAPGQRVWASIKATQVEVFPA